MFDRTPHRRLTKHSAARSYAISHLIASLPLNEKLSHDQTRFVAAFARACDQVWGDEVQNRCVAERKVHHFLLLGQGGFGKTHVVQKIIFEAVAYIWPVEDKAKDTLMVVAFSNAQAKNISTPHVKARTVHSACAMRVQRYVNNLMRPGKMQKQLTTLWEDVRVLVIEEVSVIGAAVYNMMDLRAAHGRSSAHDVSEHTYHRENHHFGRVPIVIHLGDFLQLAPTAQISLIADPNEKLADGSYKLKDAHASRVEPRCRGSASS